MNFGFGRGIEPGKGWQKEQLSQDVGSNLDLRRDSAEWRPAAKTADTGAAGPLPGTSAIRRSALNLSLHRSLSVHLGKMFLSFPLT